MQALKTLSARIPHLLLIYLSPIVDLGMRLFVANDFFRSGWLKFQNYLNDTWYLTVATFEQVCKVPYLSPEVAAFLATFSELFLASLLALGLFSRLSAFGILAMVGVIEYTIGTYPENYHWTLMSATILARGGGTLSMDFLIKKLFKH